MPWTADGTADDETLGEWPAVVRTGRGHGERFVAHSHDEDVIAVGLAEDGGSVSQVRP
jgi:hypothetical protein